jgi:cell wall assembly regulator SMI1
MEVYVKSLFLILLVVLSSYVRADEYQWCQIQMELVKDYYNLNAEDLVEKKREIALADTVEKLTKATERDYPKMVSMLLKQSDGKAKANEFVIEFMKSLEMSSISMAIKLKEVNEKYENEADAYFWNDAYDTCVKNSSDKS